MRVGITIDVPDIAAALDFYGAVFGMVEHARPAPHYAMIGNGDVSIGLSVKSAASRPTPDPDLRRSYARHWTPVHLDFHVEDHEATLAAILAAGGAVEQRHAGGGGRPSVAFCADPFGHGFCVLGPRA